LKNVWKKFKPRASGRFLKLERFQRCLKKNHNKERLEFSRMRRLRWSKE
jgi:hypothetical protein